MNIITVDLPRRPSDVLIDGEKLPLDVDFLVLQLLEPGYDQDVIDAVLRDILQLRDEDGIIRVRDHVPSLIFDI